MLRLVQRFRDYRNRRVGDPEFRARAEKSKLTQWIARRQSERLFALCSGFVHSQVLVACVRLGLPARLASGPRTLGQLAAETGLPGDRLARFLQGAAALDLVEIRNDGGYALGALGAALNGNAGLERLILHHDALYRDLDDPLALLEGSAQCRRLHDYWPYAGRDRPCAAAVDAVADYSATMAASQAMIATRVVEDPAFAGARRLLDIGGGDGTFAIAAARRWPQLSVTVADLPAVAALATENIARAGLGDRIHATGIDFLSEPLPSGFDCATLVRVLHDHDDRPAADLLRSARRALEPGGALLVVEPMAGKSAAGRLVDAYFSIYLLAMGQGRPRSARELRGLLRAAGFVRMRGSAPLMPVVARAIRAAKPT